MYFVFVLHKAAGTWIKFVSEGYSKTNESLRYFINCIDYFLTLRTFGQYCIADKISLFDQQIAISRQAFDGNLKYEGVEKYGFKGLSVKVEY